MASIKEVAEAAGVSTATVSRVLANKPHVTPDLRERVLAAVARLDYRPNRVARSLRSQQSNTIGLIVSDIRNPFFTAISRAVEDTAYEHGYSVMLCNTDENPAKESMYLNLMRDERVGGIIYSPTRKKLASFSASELAVPAVLIDRAPRNGNVDAVLLDNIAAGYQLAEHLIDSGYRRIGGVFGEASTTGRERRQGLEEALRARGLAPADELLTYVQPKIEAGRAAVLALLDADQPPDAIFTSNSLLTSGALLAIRERGLAIPDQVALVGFDETTWAALVQPAITLIEQPTYEIGQTATELLLQRIVEPHRSPRKVIVQGKLLVRGSSAPRTG